MPSPIRLLDGGLGTSLEDRYGIRFSQAETPLWSSHLLVEDPQLSQTAPLVNADTLRRCQADFCRAGIDVLETATYQIGPQALQRVCTAAHPHGLSADPPAVRRLLERAISTGEAAIREAAVGTGTTDSVTSLALSLGPYGACMAPSTEYSGRYDAAGDGLSALQRWHADRLRLFAAVPRVAQRVQYLAFETVPRRDEIAAIRAVMSGQEGQEEKDLSGLLRLPYWISCVFPEDVAGLPDGSSVEDAVAAMLASDSSHPPSAIGINCTKIHRLPALLASYEATVARLVEAGQISAWPALVLYPDGTNGEIYDPRTQQWVRPLEDGPDAAASGRPRQPWEARMSEIVLATAQRSLWREILVGGCCKTTDRDIRALREALVSGGGILHSAQ